MIEVTITEVALFAWAIIATGAWLRTKEKNKAAEFFIRALLEDEELRDTILADYKKFTAKREV